MCATNILPTSQGRFLQYEFPFPTFNNVNLKCLLRMLLDWPDIPFHVPMFDKFPAHIHHFSLSLVVHHVSFFEIRIVRSKNFPKKSNLREI